MNENTDINTVRGFGDEWERYDQSKLAEQEHRDLFDRYFSVFPWNSLSGDAIGFDLGCGSGRWAKLVAPKVGTLHCIDPSAAIDVARRNLADVANCVFHQNSVENMPLDDCSMDFGYSLGVLHHIPDTSAALQCCVQKLKPGAPFLLYLYYAFDNKPGWFRAMWRVSDLFRKVISRLPYSARFSVCKVIAATVYFPLARIAKILDSRGFGVENFPLAIYRNCSFYTMSTDALDRFGTQLEQRFTKKEIIDLMHTAGLGKIKFSDKEVYWCAVGYKQ